jgi:ATP-binding cassette, subfamily F, member 3
MIDDTGPVYRKIGYMSVSLQIQGAAKGFNNLLFSDVNINVFGNQKIALIGDNGSGKSTFLKIISGKEILDRGKIIWGPGVKIGYLEQEIISDAYEVSGGEQKILRITELFYSDYDVLLMDEPDNHLDLDHKTWFEQLVTDFPGMIIVISHDRHFLSTSITQTWQLEEKRIKQYNFGYIKFKEIYEQEIESRQKLWDVQEKERLRLAEIVEQFRIKAARNDSLAKQLHGAEKRYQRWVDQMVAKPPQVKTARLKTSNEEQPHRKTALQIKSLAKSYKDNRVLTDINLHVFCGEKISITAPNGSGKSTLLNILINKFPADTGEFNFGPSLKVGYYAQEHLEALDEQATMIEELQKSKAFPHYDAIAYLKRFLFTADQAVNEIRFLSGGQKSRLQLAKFLSTNPDILILDEPTNHLDLKTVLALEIFLKSYTGTLILVSHDRELVSHVVDQTYQLSKGKLLKN